MAYDNVLAERVHNLLKGAKGITSKRMFGGLVFLVDAKMMCGVSKRGLMVRIGKDNHDEMVKLPGARPMVLSGRKFRGFLVISPEVIATSKTLGFGVKKSLEFVKTCKKSPQKKRKPRLYRPA